MQNKNIGTKIALLLLGIAALVILVLSNTKNISAPLSIFLNVTAVLVLLGFGQQILVISLTGIIFMARKVYDILRPAKREYDNEFKMTVINNIQA